MVRRTKLVCSALVCLELARSIELLGGIKTLTGSEPGCWDKDAYSVIMARVDDVRPSQQEPWNYKITLAPIATMSGSFDAGASDSLRLAFVCGTSTTSIEKPPRGGDTIMVVIREDEGVTYIVRDICKFMPDDSALVTIKGLDDPRI